MQYRSTYPPESLNWFIILKFYSRSRVLSCGMNGCIFQGSEWGGRRIHYPFGHVRSIATLQYRTDLIACIVHFHFHSHSIRVVWYLAFISISMAYSARANSRPCLPLCFIDDKFIASRISNLTQLRASIHHSTHPSKLDASAAPPASVNSMQYDQSTATMRMNEQPNFPSRIVSDKGKKSLKSACEMYLIMVQPI